MARTRKTRPLMVRALDPRDADVPLGVEHDHSKGSCDLKDYRGAKLYQLHDNSHRCGITRTWSGKGVCGCRMCTDHYERRAERRRSRHSRKRQLMDMCKSQDYEAYF